jgi:hypothetical protein
MFLRVAVVLLLCAPHASLAQGSIPTSVPDDEPSQPPPVAPPPATPVSDAEPPQPPAAAATATSARAAFWANSLIMPTPSFSLLPVEAGALDSHVELQLTFTRTCDFALNTVNKTYPFYTPRSPAYCINVLWTALDGQYAIRDRLEIGLNLMFLKHTARTMIGGSSSDSDTELGNLTLNLKARILGRSRGPFALSVFANTTFPTATFPSGTLHPRDWAILHAGVGVSGALGIVTLGADLGSYWYIRDGKNTDLFLIDLFAGVHIHRVLSAFLALQMDLPAYLPDYSPMDGVGLVLSPGVRITPYRGLYLDLAARISATDTARLLYTAGRAALIFAGGYRF